MQFNPRITTLEPRITTPYPGLRPFEAYETPIFFGREDQSDQLIEKLRGDQHFLAVLGLSGSGKSSLVRTGLLAGLRRDTVARGCRGTNPLLI